MCYVVFSKFIGTIASMQEDPITDKKAGIALLKNGITSAVMFAIRRRKLVQSDSQYTLDVSRAMRVVCYCSTAGEKITIDKCCTAEEWCKGLSLEPSRIVCCSLVLRIEVIK